MARDQASARTERRTSDEGKDDLEDEDTYYRYGIELVVEVMGRVSNIVLVEEDGTVMDSIKRIPSSINRYRVTLPHHLYVPPPPQEKRDPTHTTINAMALGTHASRPGRPKGPSLEGFGERLRGSQPHSRKGGGFRALGNVTEPATKSQAVRLRYLGFSKSCRRSSGRSKAARGCLQWRTRPPAG